MSQGNFRAQRQVSQFNSPPRESGFAIAAFQHQTSAFPPAIYKFKRVLPFCLGAGDADIYPHQKFCPRTFRSNASLCEGHRNCCEAGLLSPTSASSIICLLGIVFTLAHWAYATGLFSFFFHLVSIISIFTRAHQRNCWDHLGGKSQKPQTNQPT